MSAPTSERETIGFVGVGTMGAPMVGHLTEAGFEVLAHDADHGQARAVAEVTGAVAVADAGELAAATLVICMLPNSRIVEAVLDGDDGLLARLAAGTLVVDMGSSEPTSTRTLAERASAHDIELVDAPVSGGLARARSGELTIMFGGSAAALERARPALSRLGSSVVHVGDVGAGHAMKALNNLLSAVGLAAACEVIEAGRRFGLDPEVMLDVLNQSTGRNQATEAKVGQFILSGSYASGFALRLMLKDVGIALELARDGGVSTPIGDSALELWARAAEQLPADADQTLIARMTARDET